MLKNKKVVLLVALATAVLIGSIAGLTFAQTGNGGDSQAKTQYEAFLDKVSQIYQQNTGVAIDAQQLKTAFAEAQKETQNEALQSWLQNLVGEGKITQEQADQYLRWWQSRPDTPLLGPRGGGGMMWGRGHNCWGGPFTPPENSDTSGS
ncbi:MAG: hypothetical protein A2Y59_05625 [Chloroflexi bacterium RBG_13_52_14]|nr:MAG: hypothetical protein A2Y59_05625 [Chloroflexi bacterium RBG_13_52_14]